MQRGFEGIRTHRAIGNIGIAYGVLIWVLGVIVSFAAPAFNVTFGEWTVAIVAALT